MKNKKVLIVSAIALVIVIIIVMLVIKVSSRNRELAKLQSGIESTYKELESNIKDYNGNRELISTKLDDYYTDNLESDYEEFVKILNEQEVIVGKIKVSAEKLGKDCGDRLYPDSNVNKMCNNYKDYYETVANVFVSDCNDINEIIDKYNKVNNKNLAGYKAKDIVDYIDYNKDGKYLGRN